MSSDQTVIHGFNSFFSDSVGGPVPQLDRYEFRRKLGEGKFGEVWLAGDKLLERLVAIKLAHPLHLPNPADTRILIAEARSLAAMTHPNIIDVYDLGETSEGRFYIVSRFVDGSDLSQILKRGIQDFEFTTEIIATVAEALDSAHKRGFVHRDIKPANILIDDATQRPFLADFGLAQRESDILSHSQLAGTPLYMSPEQVRAGSSRLDGRSDVFSLGCVLYQMVTGVHPFTGKTTNDVLSAIVNSSPIPPQSLNEAIPHGLEEICLKALQKDPSDRFATAGEMAEAIRRLAEVSKPTPSGEPQTIGSYRLLKKIGEGGMGVVYEAEQKQPVRRQVALKIIKTGVSSDEAKRRFQAERQALSVLNHPNIASVYESGISEDGRLYFTMELVTGSSITNYCETHHLSLDKKLELFIEVCDAIQHAHQKGIVHRDIKPSNVMVSHTENVSCIKVIDFGLAKAMQPIGRLTEKELVTEFGKELGTYEYMSPEQAGLNALDVDTRSDVYSLGVLLYELLTGSRPFERRSLDRIDIEHLLISIRTQEPERPSQRLADNRNSPFMQMGELHRADLDWITMKAMEKDRDRRYESASQFADDIRRYLKQEPVTARPPSFVYLMQKAVRRHRLAIGIAALIAATLVLGIFSTSWQMLKARAAEKKADFERTEAIAARAETEASLARTNYLLAVSRWDEGRTKEAFDLLYQVPPGLRYFEWYLARHAMDSGHTTLYGHASDVNSVRINAKSIVSGSYDGSVRLWDRSTRKELHSFRGHDGGVNAVALSPDGRFVASGGTDGTIRLLDPQSLDERLKLAADGVSVNCVAFSLDGSSIASGDDNGMIRIWDTTTGQTKLSIPGHAKPVRTISFRPGHPQLASGGDDASLKIWNLNSEIPVADLKGHGQWVTSIAFTPDGEKLASGSADHTVRVWSLTEFKEIAQYTGSSDWILAVAFSPDGKQIAMAGANQPIRLWTIETGQHQLLKGHRGNKIFGLDFSPDGSQLITGSSDAMIKVWDLASKHVDGVIGEDLWEIESLSFQTTGQSFVSVGSDSKIRRWDPASRMQIGEIENEYARVHCAAIDSTGANIISGHDDGTIVVWDAVSNSAKSYWKGHDGAIHALSFVKGKEFFATGGDDGLIKIWNNATGKELKALRGHDGSVRSIATSPDGLSIASGSVDGTVRCWDLASGEPRDIFTGHSGSVHSVCFSPDGSQIASTGQDGAVRIWNQNRQGSKTPEMLHGHQRHADCVAFTTDGKRIAAGGADGTVRIWDTVTRAELRKFQVASSWVKQIAFSPNGRQLVIGDHDGRIRIWDAPREFETQTLTGNDAALSELAFTLDSTQLSCRDAAGRIICWKYSEGQWSRAPKGQLNPDSETSANNRSPDGRWLAIPYENSITLVDLNFKAEVQPRDNGVKVAQPVEN